MGQHFSFILSPLFQGIAQLLESLALLWFENQLNVSEMLSEMQKWN